MITTRTGPRLCLISIISDLPWRSLVTYIKTVASSFIGCLVIYIFSMGHLGLLFFCEGILVLHYSSDSAGSILGTFHNLPKLDLDTRTKKDQQHNPLSLVKFNGTYPQIANRIAAPSPCLVFEKAESLPEL